VPELPDIALYLHALDRSLSRPLKRDWPRSIDAWEARLGDDVDVT